MFWDIIVSTGWNQTASKEWEMPSIPLEDMLSSCASYPYWCWLKGTNQERQHGLLGVLVPKIMLYVKMPDLFHAPFRLMLLHCKGCKHLGFWFIFKISKRVCCFQCRLNHTCRSKFLQLWKNSSKKNVKCFISKCSYDISFISLIM